MKEQKSVRINIGVSGSESLSRVLVNKDFNSITLQDVREIAYKNNLNPNKVQGWALSKIMVIRYIDGEGETVAVSLTHKNKRHCTSDIRSGHSTIDAVISSSTEDGNLHLAMTESVQMGLLSKRLLELEYEIEYRSGLAFYSFDKSKFEQDATI